MSYDAKYSGIIWTCDMDVMNSKFYNHIFFFRLGLSIVRLDIYTLIFISSAFETKCL